MLSPALKSAFKFSLFLFLGIAVLYFAFRGQDLEKIWLEIRVANVGWVFFSLLLAMLANIVRALRWQMLYHSIGYKVSFKNVFFGLFVGYLANLALPRFGELVRCQALNRQANVPLFASIGTVITERLFDLVVLFLSTMAVFFFEYQLVAEFITQNLFEGFLQRFTTKHIWWIIVGVFSLAIVAGLVVIFLRRRFKRKLLRMYSALRHGLNSYQKLERKPLFLCYSIGIWMLYVFSIFVAFLSLKSTANLGLETAFTAMVFSGLAMAVPVQGGIGIFHWMMANCLLLYGIAFNDGLAYATIIYAVQLLPIVFFGGIGFWILFNGRPKPG